MGTGMTAVTAATRKAFEAWLLSEQWLTATWNEERNCYDEFPAHLAFKAWQASDMAAAVESDESFKREWALSERVERLSQALEYSAIIVKANHINNGSDPSMSRAIREAEEQLGRPIASVSGSAEETVRSDSDPMESVIRWFPIETAPRSEQHILLGCEEASCEGWYDAGYGWCIGQDTPWPYAPPTHWAHLPDLPRKNDKAA